MLIFKNKETKCTLEILLLMEQGQSKYTQFFKKTKVSHTTLQRVLLQLVDKKLIIKRDIGHKNVSYKITEKGRNLLTLLQEVEDLIK